jgi:hypothetical protein
VSGRVVSGDAPSQPPYRPGALILIVAVLVCSGGNDATPTPPPAGWNTDHAAALSFGSKQSPGSMSVANNKDPNQKQPGEKEPGKYHYNPGNMSEKTIDSGKPESQQRANIDRIKSRGEQPHSRDD